jgi:2'-5' RNA ligase
MRLFVCSFLSAENQAFYGRRMGEVIGASGRVLRGVPPESVHITYAFLQHRDERLLEETVDAVTVVASRHEPIDVRLGAPFIMYARTEARLVCAPVVDGAAAVSRLTMDVVRELERRLPAVDVSGSRSPHVTLARFRRGIQRRDAAAVSDMLTRNAADGSLERADRVAAVQAVSSELTTTGPLYIVKADIPLHE